MSDLVVVGCMILSVINVIIYHKFFRVYYFNVFRGIAHELTMGFIVGILEMALVVAIGTIVLKIIGIIVAILIIVTIIKKRSSGVTDTVSEKTESIRDGKTNKDNKAEAREVGENITSEKNSNIIHKESNTTLTDNNDVLVEPAQTKPVQVQSPQRESQEKKFVESEEYHAEVPQKQKEREQQKQQNMFCPHCGRTILRTAKFCNFCGKENTYIRKEA